MWKIPFYTILLATVFLGGCNWGNKAVDETPVENNVRRGVNDVENDVQRGVNDVEDALTPDKNKDAYDRNVDGTNRETINNNGVTPNADVNTTNGVNGNVKDETIIEEKVERDRINNP